MKRLRLILLSLVISFIGVSNVNASSATLSVSSSSTSPVVGSEVNVYVKLSSSVPLGALEYTISYDSSKLKLTSGTSNVVWYAPNSNTNTISYSYKFKVIAKGASTVSVKSYDAFAFDESKFSLSVGSVRISGITQADLEASYSKNNDLSSLSIEGYEFSESFSKDKTEYSVSVPSDTLKIKLNGKVEDSKSSVTGLGEFDVSEGENKFEIKVTAQNGSVKTYVVKVNVVDTNPLTVIVDNKEMTVVKRVNTLEIPSSFEEVTENINGVEVPAFKSSITDYILVGLKDSEGNVNLYLYKDNNYTLYKEIKSNGVTLFPIENSNTKLNRYSLVKLIINDIEVNAYNYKNSDSYIIYGVNVENGKEGFYQYDKVSNSFTLYDDSLINDLDKRIENYLLIIIVLGVETIIMLLILISSFVRSKNRRERAKKLYMDKLKKDANTNKGDRDEKESN